MTIQRNQLEPTPSGVNDWRELAARESDGLEVILAWSRSADQVRVTVSDLKLDVDFTLFVAGADALDAYHHPFAFGAERRTCSAEAARDSGIQLRS
jgi:hypothetical protein